MMPESPPHGCRITVHALLESPLSGLDELRSRPAPAAGPPLPARFLRHADEQTVVGMHAVLMALGRLPQPLEIARHSVVAAPCQSGRLAAARMLAALPSGGAAIVSPHVVPQCSLHSVAGAVSVALGMHGPHLGVGGGPAALAEGLLAAATLVTAGGDPDCPAAWVVATEWADEPALDHVGAASGDPVCRALAMLLEPAAAADGGDEGGAHAGTVPTIALDVRFPAPPAAGLRLHQEQGDLLPVARALAAMAAEAGALATWTLTCRWGGEIRLSARPRPATTRTREAA